ncbi:MAG: hypothetical protein HW395_61 [candidate division NC10 bacterium]|nr:hypothetical protein [candidate division NC10 bacterium]
MSAMHLSEWNLRALRRIVRLVDTPEEMLEANVTTEQLQQIRAAIVAALPAPVPTPTAGCFGGKATVFTPVFVDPRTGGTFYVSDTLGGQSPDGLGEHLGVSYYFVGVSGARRSVWAPRYADNHTLHVPTEATILAALATVGGVRYVNVGSADPLDGGCSIYEAGLPGWPAPGPNYTRVGTSGAAGIPEYSLGAGLPLYARPGVNPGLLRFALQLTGGS